MSAFQQRLKELESELAAVWHAQEQLKATRGMHGAAQLHTELAQLVAHQDQLVKERESLLKEEHVYVFLPRFALCLCLFSFLVHHVSKSCFQVV